MTLDRILDIGSLVIIFVMVFWLFYEFHKDLRK